MNTNILLILVLSFVVTSCSQTENINEKNIHLHVKELSSDKFEGREPGTVGGELTKKYIKESFKSSGLQPIKKDFLLEVPLSKMEVNLDESYLKFIKAKNQRVLIPGEETVFWSKRVKETIEVKDSEVLFIGYGIVAPEYEWNDYEGIDVKGKTLIALINDPGFKTQDPNLFNGNAMTYYGRWVYRFEEAARQGAEALIIIHETAPASYPWKVVQNSWSGKQIDLKRPNLGMDRIKVEGWITDEVAEELFNEAGLDLGQLKEDALSSNFKPVPLKGVKMNAKLSNDLSFSVSHNVGGIKVGSKRPDEYVLMIAHWDHLGKRESHSPSNDQIYNGAVDNATGVAGVIELANSFKNVALDRSLLFLAVTAEESGLLGSQYFAEYPPIELSNIVAGYNFDGILPTGKTRDVVVVGYGASELENILEEELNELDMYITPDPAPEKGFFYRSDHISFAKKGVPMLYADGGVDINDGGLEAGSKMSNDYTQYHYHQPSDEYQDSWDLSGFKDHLEITRNMVLRLANSEEWPEWYEGNEFKAIREASKEIKSN
ncbi:MAG: M28 family metallopeptidase [Gammaproteobacteria bacterium]